MLNMTRRLDGEDRDHDGDPSIRPILPIPRPEIAATLKPIMSQSIFQPAKSRRV
jgi:hypothetical protein